VDTAPQINGGATTTALRPIENLDILRNLM
jgi:hypothetical protein